MPPLGILDEVEWTSDLTELEPGSLILLYTDGLIERRDAHLHAGLDRLKQLFAAVPGDAEGCLDALAEAYRTEEIPDDVAMLAVAIGERQSGTG